MDIAALVTWVVTAGFGFFMLATWVSGGGTRPGGATHFRRPVVFGHFLLAAAGLVLWIVYVIVDVTALAWIAFADLVVVAGFGDVLVLRWRKDRRLPTSYPTGSAGSAPAAGGATSTMTAQGEDLRLAEQRIPLPVVVLHGVFAVATVVLVFLAALGIGG